MPETILCKICGKRRARRACPAVGGDICTICCGTEREVSLACPLECEYLQEAHRHEKPVPANPAQFPYREVPLSEDFLAANSNLLLFCAVSLLNAATSVANAVDTDVVAALEAEIQTHRTAESGLIYQSKPENFVALGVQRAFSASLADYQKTAAENDPLKPVRNSDMLGLLVFLYRWSVTSQNGRPRGRMFIDQLRQMARDSPMHDVMEESRSGIII